MRGECLACKKVNRCTETNLVRMKSGYTCPLFEEVPEPIYTARYDLIQQYGDEMALRAIKDGPEEEVREE